MSKRRTKQQSIDTQKLCVLVAFCCALSLCALYIYFVSATVLHVVMREEVERKIGDLHSEIAALETKYIEAQHAVSADIATREGYVEAENKIFIDRSAAAVALSEAAEQ